MKRLPIVCLLYLIMGCFRLYAQSESDIIQYIGRYKDLAVDEQLRSGVPAAITLAQGIHESSAGQSELAIKGNNHFGIKCKSNWTGETILHDDDLKKECFRKYTSDIQSYIDHSDFLKSSNRYHFLFDLDPADYAAWASGLKRAGYATNPMYVKRLTDLVEKYNLQQYTFEAISKSNQRPKEIVPEKDEPRNLTHIDDPATYYKGLKGFWAKKGETLLPYALDKNIRFARLLDMNDMDDIPLPYALFIFTEKKRRIGTEEFHVVQAGETMHLISQKEAIQLNSLYTFNNMVPGQEPAEGQKLHLQYKSAQTPRLKTSYLETPIVTQQAGRENTTEENLSETGKVVQTAPVSDAELLAKRRAEAKARYEAEERERQEKLRVAREAEELARKEAEEKTRKEAEELARKEAEEKVRKEAEELARKEAEEKIARESDAPQTQQPSVISESNSTVTDKVILDPVKAARIDAILSDEPINQPEVNTSGEKQVQKSSQQNASSPAVSQSESVIPPTESIPPATLPVSDKPETQVVKRTYNETHVADSVKLMKERFDQTVYKYRPPTSLKAPVQQKPATQPTTTGAVTQPQSPAKRTGTSDNGRQQNKSNPKNNKQSATPAKGKHVQAKSKDQKTGKDKGKQVKGQTKLGKGSKNSGKDKKAGDTGKNKPKKGKSKK